jgi:hypothetical protein
MNNSAVLPSLEAFEMGIEIPTVYILFYEFFFRSSCGDVRWKRNAIQDKDLMSPLGTPVSEAFAMIQLKNN